MVYLITYDLNKVGKDYKSLYSALCQYQYIRDPSLDSVWFVSTAWTALQVYNHLRVHMDINDRIIITQLTTGGHQGWLHKDIWAWINARI